MLLIIGIMIGYLASSLISVLNYYASTDKVHAFVMWGLGNFSGVSLQQLPYFACFTCIGVGDSVDQAIECTATGRNVCRQFRNQDQADAHSDPAVYGVVDCDYDSFLRSYFLYRVGCSACRTFDVGIIQPQDAGSRYVADRFLHRVAL